MRLKEYSLSKAPYLIINLLIYLLVFILFRIADVSYKELAVIFLIWFLPMITYFLIEFFVKRRFYMEVYDVMKKLDKKYILAEVIKEPNSYEEKIVYDILKECNREMHEHVNFYKRLQRDYREYIEGWIHEVKTPIASTKLILENNENNFSGIIEDDIKKIEYYVEQVLYYCKSSEANKDYIIDKFDIKEIIQDVIRENRREFISKKISIDIEKVEGTVITDIKWVRFIINQIIINAIKYRKESNSKIEIYTELFKDKIILTIKDNGIGICEKDIDKVFDKGFTGENGRKYGKSTGIGLYLSKKLCEKLGLGITIISKENVGTKVKVIFPLSELTNLK